MNGTNWMNWNWRQLGYGTSSGRNSSCMMDSVHLVHSKTWSPVWPVVGKRAAKGAKRGQMVTQDQPVFPTKNGKF